MGTTHDDGSQQSMRGATAALPQGGGCPFYERLNQILNAAGFGAFVEKLCAPFYARMGPPSLAPGRYLIGSAERRRDVEVPLPKFDHLLTLALLNHLTTPNAQLHDWRRTRAASTAITVDTPSCISYPSCTAVGRPSTSRTSRTWYGLPSLNRGPARSTAHASTLSFTRCVQRPRSHEPPISRAIHSERRDRHGELRFPLPFPSRLRAA